VLDTGVPTAARNNRRPPATTTRHTPLRMRLGYPAGIGENARIVTVARGRRAAKVTRRRNGTRQNLSDHTATGVE
jgi:hypothetical protein